MVQEYGLITTWFPHIEKTVLVFPVYTHPKYFVFGPTRMGIEEISEVVVEPEIIVECRRKDKIEIITSWHDHLMDMVTEESIDVVIARETDCFYREFILEEEEMAQFDREYTTLYEFLTVNGMTPEIGQVALALASILHLRTKNECKLSTANEANDYEGLVTMFPMLVSRAAAGMSTANGAQQAAANILDLITKEREYEYGESECAVAQ